MMCQQDFDSESLAGNSEKTFSSVNFLVKEFGNSLFNTTQFSLLTRVIGEFGEGLIQGTGRIWEKYVEAKGSSELQRLWGCVSSRPFFSFFF